jgi:hypothetical protein
MGERKGILGGDSRALRAQMSRGFGVTLLLLGALGAAHARRPDARDELRPGLIGEYYKLDSAMEDFPQVPADQKPNPRRIDKQINWDSVSEPFAGTGLDVHFYARWTGILRVAKAGKYTFYTESDDGSRLWVDGKQVVENGGLHSMEEKSGEVQLAEGDHEFKVDLFQNEGEVGLKVSWEGAGLAKEIIPDKALFHRKDAQLDK